MHHCRCQPVRPALLFLLGCPLQASLWAPPQAPTRSSLRPPCVSSCLQRSCPVRCTSPHQQLHKLPATATCCVQPCGQLGACLLRNAWCVVQSRGKCMAWLSITACHYRHLCCCTLLACSALSVRGFVRFVIRVQNTVDHMSVPLWDACPLSATIGSAMSRRVCQTEVKCAQPQYTWVLLCAAAFFCFSVDGKCA